MKWILLLLVMYCISAGHSFLSSTGNFILNLFNYELCNDNFISPDFVKLRSDFKEMLFGQNIIIDKLIPILDSHFKHEPKKALVICMHGWTGSGKNFATKIVVDALYKKKFDSQFVHQFNGRLHFPLDTKEYVEQYKSNIVNWVRGNVTNCPRSLFIFDEVDKMPTGIIDSIKPYFDYHEKIDTVDYRKSIFIFISNIGAKSINSQYMELWKKGKSRINMVYKDFEPLLREALYNKKGAFQKSVVLEDHLVSLYLPFLPLDDEQVRKCIKAEIIRQNTGPVSEEYVDSVLEEMEFNSDGFSTSGCKRVAELVATLKFKYYNEL